MSGITPRSLRYALVAFVLGLLAAARVGRRAAVALGGLLAAAVLAFHRDPDRSPPDAGAVAPADGTVSVVRTEEHAGDARVRVGVYMSALDVHVNRAPLPGTVSAVEHVDGGHRLAFSKESEHNERIHIDVSGPGGTGSDGAGDGEADGGGGDHRVTLIAGAFARRIHPYVAAGDELARGDRIGHISFGSRADVLLPAGVRQEDLLVDEGETVRAGETILARSSEL